MIAPVPPPVTGQSLVTVHVQKSLASTAEVVVMNTAPSLHRSWAEWGRRLGRLCRVLLMIPVARLRGARSVYISVLAFSGMAHSAACALLARLLGCRVFLHHHVSSYVRWPTTRMRCLAICAGAKTQHIVLCSAMERELRHNYPNIRHTLILGNGVAVPALPATIPRRTAAIRVGHLGNLSLAKGLEAAIAVLRRLLDQGVDARLILGGPPVGAAEADIISQAAREFADRLRHVGPVRDDEKDEFYQGIDVFLFPSLYRHEAAPLVCLEAMAAGRPVIAYDWGYLSSLVPGGGGVLIDVGADFAEHASRIVQRWAARPDELLASSRAARQRFEQLHAEGTAQLATFRRLITGEATAA